MDDCCNDKASEITAMGARHSSVLKVVLALNLVMFFVESISGYLSHSTALFADSLDMLGDAFVYALSLYVIGKGHQWSARASLVKGLLMAVFAITAFGQVIYQFVMPVMPLAETMGWIGGLALLVNLGCLMLLLRHRDDNINMRSTWLCSRNDVISNCGVLVAAAMVAFTRTRYPDLVIGVIVAAVVLKSAVVVLREALHELKIEPDRIG